VIPPWPAPALDYTLLEPYGVIGVIIPWNAVMHNIGQVLGGALAAGNCVLLKAPELAPFEVLRFGELVLNAGIPPGVVNIVAGGPEAGRALVAHAGIDKIHFIGSGATAANHDERRYTAPELFDMHRVIERPIVFGFGVHRCLGAALARLKARVAFEELLDRFPDYEIDKSEV
jgi:hypothetical protein